MAKGGIRFSFEHKLFAAMLFIRTIAAVSYSRLEWGLHNEVAAIADSLLHRHVFGSVYGLNEPTAWLAPAYPFLTALAFETFGETTRAVTFMIALNVIVASMTAVFIYRIGSEYFNETTGRIAGLVFVVSPLCSMVVALPWDTTIGGFVFVLATYYTLKQRSVIAGCLWGLAALTNPICVAGLPFMFRKKRALMFCVAVLVVAPWVARDYMVMGKLMPIRSNGIAEIAFASLGFDHHPLSPTSEYKSLGEVKFVELMARDEMDYVKQKPAQFLRSCGQSFLHFWAFEWPVSFLCAFGLIFYWKERDSSVILGNLIGYPIIAYLSYSYFRNRYPVEPFVCLMAAYGVNRLYCLWIVSSRDEKREPMLPAQARAIAEGS